MSHRWARAGTGWGECARMVGDPLGSGCPKSVQLCPKTSQLWLDLLKLVWGLCYSQKGWSYCPLPLSGCCGAAVHFSDTGRLWAKMGASSFSVREEWVCPSWAESQAKISINAYKLYTKLHKYCHMFHAVCAWQKPHLQLLLQVSLQKWVCTGSSKGFPCSSLHITITALPTWTN